jgi:uncharacterized protein (DUF1800 family)
MGMRRAVHSLTRPSGRARLIGPRPHDNQGRPLAPEDAFGHDHLWWLDRMVRSNQQFTERLTLVLHDWFATSNSGVSRQRQMIDQSNLLRQHGRGSFLRLFELLTINPAMLQWLSGDKSTRQHPNENYGREMMELFSLGAERGAYTEADIRQAARALTGWRSDSSPERGDYNFRYDPRRHDKGRKKIFGHTGRYDWRDAVRLCVHHPLHPTFFVDKLWSYFIPTPVGDRTMDELTRLYRRSGWRLRPVAEAILTHHDFYEGPPMIKPPVVYLASMLRRLGRYIDTEAWIPFCDLAGQLLFWPPNVSGWDDSRWLDTSRMRGRWRLVELAVRPTARRLTQHQTVPQTPEAAVAEALQAWGRPRLRAAHTAELQEFARRAVEGATPSELPERTAMRTEGLLQLIGISPDLNLQ